jgi:hypothetical protein
MRVDVWFKLFRLVRVTVRVVFALVLVLVGVAFMGMRVLMFVDVVVFMSVRGLVVRVLMCMGVSVFVLMLVAMVVFICHWVSSLFSVRRMASSD